MKDVGLRPTGDDDTARVDAVIASEILSHHVVLNDVTVEVRRDDPFPDRVIPAGHIPDERQPQPTRSDEEGRDLFHLKIAQDDRRPLHAQPFEELVRDVTAT